MLPRSIDIGPFSLHLYGLIIAIAIYTGWSIAKKRASFYNIPISIFDDPILLIPLIFSIVGARLYHVIDLWTIYSVNPISILYIANGGLGIWGAIIGLVIGLLVVTKSRNLNLLSSLDLAAPSMLLGQAIGRFGNYINQEGFGPPTNLPWGVYIEKINRPAEYITFTQFHPAFFYEALLNILFFILLLKLSLKLKFKGQAFALYLIFYSTSRFIVEFFRIDTWTIGAIKIAHIISLITLVFGIYLLTNLKKKRV